VNVIQVRKPKEHQMNIVSNSTTKIILLVMNVSFHYELLWCYMNTVTYPKNLAKCYMHETGFLCSKRGSLDGYVERLGSCVSLMLLLFFSFLFEFPYLITLSLCNHLNCLD
jgi:hypothetical protein